MLFLYRLSPLYESASPLSIAFPQASASHDPGPIKSASSWLTALPIEELSRAHKSVVLTEQGHSLDVSYLRAGNLRLVLTTGLLADHSHNCLLSVSLSKGNISKDCIQMELVLVYLNLKLHNLCPSVLCSFHTDNIPNEYLNGSMVFGILAPLKEQPCIVFTCTYVPNSE